MNLSPAFDLGAYAVKFEPNPGDGAKVRCAIWTYGERNVQGGYPTLPFTSSWRDQATAAFDEALNKLRSAARKPAEQDLEDIF